MKKTLGVSILTVFKDLIYGSKDRSLINYENWFSLDIADLRASDLCKSSRPLKSIHCFNMKHSLYGKKRLYRIGKYGPSRRISFQLRRDKKQFS